MDSISLTPERIKGLAHPLRVALLALLRSEGPATATQLADQLDTSSGATSYHLRELEKHGFISTREELGVGRERYWEANHQYTILDKADLSDDPEALALYDEFVRLGALRREAEVAEWLSTQDDWGPEWASAAAMDDHLIRATPDELRDLHDQVSDLIAQLATRDPKDAPEGAAEVVAHFLAFPLASHLSQIREIATAGGDS